MNSTRTRRPWRGIAYNAATGYHTFAHAWRAERGNLPNMQTKYSFPAVAAADARLLILGSLPGEQSLAQAQYYAHPQNAFWRLVGEVIGVDLVAQDYAARLATLRAHRIGLWDVVASASRSGSLDSQIRDHTSNDIAGLLARLPQLSTIAFNGATAARHGLKQLGDTAAKYRIVQLPSSSPAHTLAYAQKLQAWLALADALPPA